MAAGKMTPMKTLINIIASVIYWAGIMAASIMASACLYMLGMILREPHQMEYALTALGITAVIVALFGVWMWAKMRRQ